MVTSAASNAPRIRPRSSKRVVDGLHARREGGEVVVAEVGLLRAGGDDEAVERRHRLHGRAASRSTVWLSGRSASTSPSSTWAFFCLRRISRVVGAISPSERMPVATW